MGGAECQYLTKVQFVHTSSTWEKLGARVNDHNVPLFQAVAWKNQSRGQPYSTQLYIVGDSSELSKTFLRGHL